VLPESKRKKRGTKVALKEYREKVGNTRRGEAKKNASRKSKVRGEETVRRPNGYCPSKPSSSNKPQYGAMRGGRIHRETNQTQQEREGKKICP